MEDLEDKDSRSPGADDNASGMSSVLEVARLLYELDLEDSIQFVFFSGEDQGRWGATEYASYIKEKSISLYRLINLDMVGICQLGLNQVIIERDIGNKTISNDKESEAFAQTIGRITANLTDLQAIAGPIYMSD